GEAAAGQEVEASPLDERRVLDRDLPQVLRAKPEGVRPQDFRHRFLSEVVIGDPELRYVGLDSEAGDPLNQNLGQCGRLWNALAPDWEIEVDAPVREAKLVGHRRTYRPDVSAQQVLRASGEILNEARIRDVRGCGYRVVDKIPGRKSVPCA